MNRFLVALVFVFLKFSLVSLLSLPWVFFDPLLALVVIYTFFHSLDAKDFALFALFCGFLGDIFSSMTFGTFMLSYLACAYSVSFGSRIVYRQNWIFVFPLVFLAAFANNHFVFFLALLLPHTASIPYSGWFLARAFAESVGTTLAAYPLYLFAKRWLPELIG